eukprot:UN23750
MKNISLFTLHEDQKLYIFFSQNKKFWNHPFHGLGHRDCAEVGSFVYFMNYEDGKLFAEKQNVPSENFLFAWNTSRCGSTLSTRIMEAVGVPSVSEPKFLDDIYNLIRNDVPVSEDYVIDHLKTTMTLEYCAMKNTFNQKRYLLNLVWVINLS